MTLSAIQNIDHTVIFCADLTRMTDFYRDLLGIPVEVEMPRWITFRVGGTRLSLAARPPDAPKPCAGPALQLAFRVPPAALDGCSAELAQKGIAIARGPADIPDWRHRAIFFSDPEGNRLEIYAEI